MRITTWNVNGLRAALRKEFAAHLDHLEPDVLMLQEIRAFPEQLPKAWREPDGWHVCWHPAERKGYSGTATWSRHPIERLGTGFDGHPDPEGRVLRSRVGPLTLVNVYLPSGSRGKRQARKDAWMDRFLPWARELAQREEPVVLGGDLNIAHTEQDIHDPVGNKRNSGFLPHERAWFSELLEAGWTDLLREDHGDFPGPYTWWSNFGRARAENRGWRIDYLLGNTVAAALCTGVSVRRQGGLDTSDHAPVTAAFDLAADRSTA